MTPAASPDPPNAAANGPLIKSAVAMFGLLLIVAGVSGWSWQAGVILAGAMLFVWAFVTSGARKKARKPEKQNGPEV